MQGIIWKTKREISDKFRQNHLFTIVRVSCRMVTGNDEERKIFHARKAVWKLRKWHDSCASKQASKQASRQTYKSVIFACNETESYRETRTSFVWHLAGQEKSLLMELSLFLKKTVETPYATFPEESELCEAWFAGNDCTLIKITYYGFCGKCATRLIGHAFLFAEQGNRVRIPDTEQSRLCC